MQIIKIRLIIIIS